MGYSRFQFCIDAIMARKREKKKSEAIGRTSPLPGVPFCFSRGFPLQRLDGGVLVAQSNRVPYDQGSHHSYCSPLPLQR